MKELMFRKRSLLIIVLLFFFPKTACPVGNISVIVLPFKIHTIQKSAYLKDEILAAITKHLKQEGVVVLTPKSLTDVILEKATQSLGSIRSLGIENGADYVIWGSLTMLGRKFSLDAKMVKSFEEVAPYVFIKEGQGIENLPGAVKQISRDMEMKLFKREKVVSVVITGNKRIEDDAIKRIIKTKPGDIYLSKSLSEDLKAVYAMGYFDDIRIESEETPNGKKIIFNVKEKPTIRVIHIKGNKVYKEDKIKENLTIKVGSILNPSKVQNNVKRIEELYKEKNYHNVEVTYKIHQLKHNQADLEFDINEGKKVLIKSIKFEGNHAYTDKQLKKLMRTSEKNFLSLVTSSGDLKMENLEQDVAILTAFYYNHGYIQARVGEPQVEYKGKWIYITIKIDEGSRFKVGKVDMAGDLIIPKNELMKKLKITHETYYNRESVRNDILTLTDIYSNAGYAYAEISPRIEKNFDELKVNIIYDIKKGKQVYFEKIIIEGNDKTRDKVIRRELSVYEQGLYSGQELKKSITNLHRLDYFEDIKVNTEKGSTDDSMVLKIDVTEKPTGTISFGAGYSSVENIFGTASVSQRNLFGRGQTLEVQAQIGSATQLYKINFTEPWLFDIPLTAGFDLYNWDTTYPSYDKNSNGGGLRFGYPVYSFTRLTFGYNYENADITNIADDAAQSIKDLKGTNITSSITTTLTYNSKNRRINPTRGSKNILVLEYAGLGGNIGFTKIVGETGWYFPLFKETVGFLHGRAGFVTQNSDKTLPDYERFYLGGMNSIRGFDWRGIYVLDDEGDIIGGDKFIQFNAEYIVPLLKTQGLVGLVFYDTGNVYNNGQSIDFGDLRSSVGFGVRWFSPMGPIRLEYGYRIQPMPDQEKGGQFGFAMGAAF